MHPFRILCPSFDSTPTFSKQRAARNLLETARHAVEPAKDPSTDGAGLPPCLPRRSDGCGTGGGRHPPPSEVLGPAPPPPDAGPAVPLACSVDGERPGSEPEAPFELAARSQGCGRHNPSLRPTSEAEVLQGSVCAIDDKLRAWAKCRAPTPKPHTEGTAGRDQAIRLSADVGIGAGGQGSDTAQPGEVTHLGARLQAGVAGRLRRVRRLVVDVRLQGTCGLIRPCQVPYGSAAGPLQDVSPAYIPSTCSGTPARCTSGEAHDCRLRTAVRAIILDDLDRSL